MNQQPNNAREVDEKGRRESIRPITPVENPGGGEAGRESPPSGGGRPEIEVAREAEPASGERPAREAIKEAS